MKQGEGLDVHSHPPWTGVERGMRSGVKGETRGALVGTDGKAGVGLRVKAGG